VENLFRQYEQNSTIAVIEGEGDDALQVFAPIDLDSKLNW